MYFCINKFEVGINDSMFSGNEQQNVYYGYTKVTAMQPTSNVSWRTVYKMIPLDRTCKTALPASLHYAVYRQSSKCTVWQDVLHAVLW